MKAAWIPFTTRDTKGGHLVAMESGGDIPFEIRRVFFVHGQDPTRLRGEHAHRLGEQVLVCLRGRCALTLDDGRSTRELVLDRPDRGLHVGPMLWEEFRLSSDALLLVLASTAYDPADYIEDRAAFLDLARRDA